MGPVFWCVFTFNLFRKEYKINMIQHCISLSLPFSESGIIGIIALSVLMKDQVL